MNWQLCVNIRNNVVIYTDFLRLVVRVCVCPECRTCTAFQLVADVLQLFPLKRSPCILYHNLMVLGNVGVFHTSL